MTELINQFNGPGWWHEDRIRAFFRDHFLPTWDVDIFEQPRRRIFGGWTSGTTECISYLVLRFEDLAADGPAALGRLLRTDDIALPRRQVSSEKRYGTIFEGVRETLRFSNEYLERAYSSLEVRYFYPDEHVERVHSRWGVR